MLNLAVRLAKYIKLLIFVSFFISPTKDSNAFSLISDAEIESGIKHIVSPIIEAAGLQPKNVNIYILLNDEVNAFAVQGNNIFINTGLITLYNDANVVKGVFAHELGHVTGGHLVRRHQRMKELSTQSVVTTLLGVAAVVGGAGEAGVATVAGSMHSLERSMLRFTRENEYSADQAAFKYLERSKNSSEGLLKVMSYFESKNFSSDELKYRYMMTHPMTKERVYALKHLKPWKLDTKRNTKDQQIYSRIYAKLVGFLKDPKKILSSKKLDGDKFSKKYANAIAYYRLNDFDKSIREIDSLLKQEPNNGYLYELKAQFLFEYGRIKQAVPMYEKAMLLHSSDHLIKLEYAVALINVANKMQDNKEQRAYYHKAIKLLNVVLADQPNHAWAYRNLAIAYGRLGKIGASNLMLSEEALLNGDVGKAEFFVKIAQKKGLNKNLQLRADDIIKFITQKQKKG